MGLFVYCRASARPKAFPTAACWQRIAAVCCSARDSRRTTFRGSFEDFGVEVDEIHKMTGRDLLHRNADLIERAGKILARAEVQRLTAERKSSREVRVAYQNLDRIDAYLDDRSLGKSLAVKRSKRIGHRLLSIPRNASATGQLRLEGFRHVPQRPDELVAATRLVS